MLEIAISWDGEQYTDFTYKDIPNMKKMKLWSWVSSPLFSVQFEKLFGYDPCKYFYIVFCLQSIYFFKIICRSDVYVLFLYFALCSCELS